MYKKIITGLLIMGISLFFPIFQIQADGGMIAYYSANSTDIYEPSQTSLIVHDNDRESLYIKVAYEGETDNFVWIIPTPNYPKAEKAPEDIFEELSIYTTNQAPEREDSLKSNTEQGFDKKN